MLSYYFKNEKYNCYCLNLLSYYSEDEIYNCYCLNLLLCYSKDKEIFYLAVICKLVIY